MALTWRNVDVPTGLNQAAGQVQQSFKDVANSLKAGIDQYSGMKQDDQMAALEARLSQEQQLSGVDPLTALDAGQLRGEFGGFIDTNKARQQILGRQSTLEQQGLTTANEALAAGDFNTASQLEEQLRGRATVDTSGLKTNIKNMVYEDMLAYDPENAYINAENTDQVNRASQLLFNQSVANKNFDKAGLFVQTPEQAQQLTLAKNTEVVNQLVPEWGKKLQAALSNPDLAVGDGNKLIQEMTSKFYDGSYDVATIGQLSAAMQPVTQALAQKEMNAVTVDPRVQGLVQESITQAPEAANRIMQSRFTDLEARALKAGVPLELSEMYGNLNNIAGINERVDLTTTDGITKLNEIVKSLDFKQAGIPFFRTNFDAKEVMERLKGIDTNNVSYGGLIAALSQVDFNRWFGGDKEENRLLSVALEAERGTTDKRINAAVNFNNEKLQLNKERDMLSANIAATLVDDSKEFTVKKVGSKGVTGEQMLRFNAYTVGENLYQKQLQGAKKALKDKPTETEKPEAQVTEANIEAVEPLVSSPTSKINPNTLSMVQTQASLMVERNSQRLDREKTRLAELQKSQELLGKSSLFGVSDSRIRESENEIQRLEKMTKNLKSVINN